MALNAEYEFLFAGKDDNSFLDNFYYDLEQDHGNKSGQVFVNLEVQNNPVDAEDIGQAIFETMQKVFFEDVEADAYGRFEVALKAVNGILAQFKAQKTSEYIGNLNVVIAVVVDGNLYLTQCGDAEAYLIRKRYVSVISDGLSDDDAKDGDVFSSIAHGKLQAGDFVLFSSTRLLRYISKTELAKALVKGNLAESLDDVRDIISTEILGRIGLTGMIFSVAKAAEVKEAIAKEDNETMSMLEDDGANVVRKKETLSGKFMTALKRKKESRTEVFQAETSRLSWWPTFTASVSEFFGSFSLGGVKSGSLKKFGGNKILALLVLVIVVLIVGVVFSKSRIEEQNKIAELDEVLIGVQDMLAEADTKGSYDKPAAKVILDKAYSDALKVLNSGYYRNKANGYLVQINETRDKLDNVERIENPTILADLSAKTADVNAVGFAAVSDRLFVFESDSLYELVLDQIQDPLEIDAEEQVIAATGFDDRGSLVFMTKSGKLIEYSGGTMSFMDTDDEVFRKGVALADWSNRIYMLDANEGQVWKYAYKGTRNRFASAEGYIAQADEELDLSNVRDLAIDGAVYVLDNTGDIYKYYGGNKQEFFINDAPFAAFEDPRAIVTSDTLDQVFVLDGKGARVLVFDKDSRTGNINYSAQYLFDGVGALRDLYVDGDARRMYVLTDQKVFVHDY